VGLDFDKLFYRESLAATNSFLSIYKTDICVYPQKSVSHKNKKVKQ